MTVAQSKRYSLQTGPAERLKAKLLRILGRIFATTLQTKRLYKASEADGVLFLEKLADLAKKATPGDQAVLQSDGGTPQHRSIAQALALAYRILRGLAQCDDRLRGLILH